MPDGQKPPKRMQSQSERDVESYAAKKERDASRTPSPGSVPIMAHEGDDLTGNYKGEELQHMRSLRPTDQRFAHLETRVDHAFDELGDIRAEISEVRVEVGDGIGGVRVELATGLGHIAKGMGELAGEMKGLARVVDDQGKRQHVAYAAATDVETAGKKAEIDVETAGKKAEIDVDSAVQKAEVDVETAGKKAELQIDTAKRMDTIDAGKERRQRITKIVGGVIALLTSGAFIGWLLGTHA